MNTLTWFLIGILLTILGAIAYFVWEIKQASDEHDEEQNL